MGREDEIRLMAYSIWLQEGCPDGKDCEHWLRAEAAWQEHNSDSGASQVPKSNRMHPRRKK